MYFERREREKLELREIKQRLKWEPIKSLATFIGVAVVIVGLGVERCNLNADRRFEVTLKRHTESIGQMGHIIADVENLCRRTYSLIRGVTFSLATAPLITDAVKSRLASLPIADQDIAEHRDILIAELSSIQDRFNTGFDEVRYLKEVVALEGEWSIREFAPSPNFEIYFGRKLLTDWGAVHETASSGLRELFSLFESRSPDLEETVKSCNSFIQKMNNDLNNRSRKFCETYANYDRLCE